MNSWCRNLELLIKSRTSLIWIRTKEEERLEKLVNSSCVKLNIKDSYAGIVLMALKHQQMKKVNF